MSEVVDFIFRGVAVKSGKDKIFEKVMKKKEKMVVSEEDVVFLCDVLFGLVVGFMIGYVMLIYVVFDYFNVSLRENVIV